MLASVLDLKDTLLRLYYTIQNALSAIAMDIFLGARGGGMFPTGPPALPAGTAAPATRRSLWISRLFRKSYILLKTRLLPKTMAIRTVFCSAWHTSNRPVGGGLRRLGVADEFKHPTADSVGLRTRALLIAFSANLSRRKGRMSRTRDGLGIRPRRAISRISSQNGLSPRTR